MQRNRLFVYVIYLFFFHWFSSIAHNRNLYNRLYVRQIQCKDTTKVWYFQIYLNNSKKNLQNLMNIINFQLIEPFFFSALGIGRCYKNLVRTRVRTHFRRGSLLRVAGRRAQIWYCVTMRNLWTPAKPDLVETHMQGRKSTLFWICCGSPLPTNWQFAEPQGVRGKLRLEGTPK